MSATDLLGLDDSVLESVDPSDTVGDTNTRAVLEHGSHLSQWLDMARVNQWMCDVTVRTRRLSFFDKLSGFGKITSHTELFVICCLGGILGLFTGISILSVVEVAFWIIRYLVRKS